MNNKWFLWLVAILIGAALAFSPATFAAEKGEKAEKKEGVKEKKEELREKIFKNMSQRAAETLKEDLEAKGPVRVSEVEAAQKEIVDALAGAFLPDFE